MKIVIGFKENKKKHRTVVISIEDVEIVDHYKYLKSLIVKLCGSNVDFASMTMFYICFIKSL